MYVYVIIIYPLVNVYITMENHHFLWENSLQMANFNSYVSHNQRVYTYSVCVFLPRPSQWGFPLCWQQGLLYVRLQLVPVLPPCFHVLSWAHSPRRKTAPLTGHDGNTAVDITLKSYYLIISNIIHFNNSDDFDIIHFISFYQQQTALLYHYCT
jgi:hypothetical protein